MRAWSRRSWFGLAVGLALLMGVLLATPIRGVLQGSEDETWARCRREGVLRVGMDASYPPFAMEEGGVFRGYDVDLAREIGRRLGLQVILVNVHFDGLYDALMARRCDVLISALPYETQRGGIAYTGGYFNAGLVLVARRDDRDTQSPTDLAGRRLAVEVGSHAHQEALRLRNWQRLEVTILTARDGQAALDMLEAGQADAVMAERIDAQAAARARPALEIRGAPLTDESFVIAVRRDSPQLFAAVNGVLDALRGEGWLERLADHWL